MGWLLPTSDQVAALTSLAALIAAVAALLTLREMRSQRRSERRPEIVVVNQMVNSKKAKNHPWTNIWRIDEVSPDDLNNLNADNYSIRLFNIGTSSAKDVVVEWEYPFDDLIEKVNHLCQVSLQDFYLHRTLGDFVETESNNPAVLGFTMRTTAGMSTG